MTIVQRIASVRNMALLACPFCREMFSETETKSCPHCGLALRKFNELPLSMDGQAVAPASPEIEVLPLTYFGRNRGLLTLTALLGLIVFFLPWIAVTIPEPGMKSGFFLAAHTRLGWVWSAAISWVVLLPMVISRRTIHQMRTARMAIGLLALIPAATIGNLLLHPQRSIRVSDHISLPVRFTYEWPFWATLVLSILSFFLALKFGGRVDVLVSKHESSAGEIVH